MLEARPFLLATQVVVKDDTTRQILIGICIIGGAGFLTYMAKMARDGVNSLRAGADVAYQVKDFIFGPELTDDELRAGVSPTPGLAQTLTVYHDEVIAVRTEMAERRKLGDDLMLRMDEFKGDQSMTLLRFEGLETRIEGVDAKVTALSDQLRVASRANLAATADVRQAVTPTET